MKKVFLNNKKIAYLMETGGATTKHLKSNIILPNGYGALKYIDSLSNELKGVSKNVYIPLLRGQNGMRGELNISGGSKDLYKILSEILNHEDKKVSIICHCSSFLYLTEIASTDILWGKIENIILYSFLANPILHFDRFKIKAKIHNVSMNQNISLLNKYSDVSIYSKIPVPIHIIHANTILNRFRATNSDLIKLQQLSNIKSIFLPEKGYEIKNESQIENVKFISENYLKPLLKSNV